MARRQRNTTNEKLTDKQTKERSFLAETNLKEEENNDEENNPTNSKSLKSIETIDRTVPQEEDCTIPTEPSKNRESNSLMPLDIQQMILGDLQSEGRGDEIIVSRETAGETLEDMVQIERERSEVPDLSREEYVIHTEDDEEDEIIYMNDEDAEGGQYVIVVNSDDFVVTDENSQEVVTIENLSDLQEGSCEIITVVRESDYESSQESVDDIEGEDCDNINTVIGTIDGIHCVNISQYHSDEESSTHENSKEEIMVTEHEAEVGCYLKLGNEIETEETITCVSKSDVDMVNLSNSSKVPKHLLQNKIRQMAPNVKSSTNLVNTDAPQSHLYYNQSFNDKSTVKQEVISEIEAFGNVAGNLNNADPNKLETFTESSMKIKLESGISNCSERKDLELISNRNSRKQRTKAGKKGKTDSKNVNFISELKPAPDLQSKAKSTVFCKKPDLKEVVKEDSLPDSSEDKVQPTKEQIDSKVSTRSKRLNSLKLDVEKQFTGLTKETFEVCKGSLKNVQEQKITSNSCAQPNDSVGYKLDIGSKVETGVKVEEEKQSAFRSRSGSTDTTGSESGSNSSSGRRRSGRIKSIAVNQSTKQSELEPASRTQNVSSNSLVSSTSTSTPPVPGYEPDKPVKVKSRWRRSSELEMGSHLRRQQELEIINAKAKLIEPDNISTQPIQSSQPSNPDSPLPDREVDDILSSFQHLACNEYLTDRSKSKEAKRMVCDCVLTKEEIARGDMGCGEDCLNRLLLIECGARCMLGERCANKCFQNLEYASCEVFKTNKKGCGLRALEDIPADTFLLEYVGEVLDPKEFRKRAKDYSKDKNQHFYFMALKSDAIIDATQKGSISRFINHSCDPNAETQKWTVNGELRVGFFSKRPIASGEEITFDYQLQRYGKEAQRCYCETASCRGWIGEDPEKENKWSDLSGRNRERKEREKKKKEDKRKDMLDDIDLEEEIEKLVLKNRAHTLMLCRLMVRAEDLSSRSQLLKVLQKGETACLRLFLDYHGLRLIWSWMMDPATMSTLKVEILETLAKLPIPNKTMLQDSKVLSVVEKWSTTALTVVDAKDRSSTEDDADKVDVEKESKAKDTDKSSDDSNSSKPVETDDQQEENRKKLKDLANSLLKEWSSLKEVYRIPKKERIEQMKEHEREADKMCRDSSVERQEKSYDRHRSQDKHRNDYDRRDRERDRDRDRDRERDRDRDREWKRGRDSPDSDRPRKSAKTDDRQSKLSKMERRQLFAIKVAQEEEERLRRQHQENLWQEQVQLAAQELAQAQELAAQEVNNFTGFQGFPLPQQWPQPFSNSDGSAMPPPQLIDQQIFGPLSHSNPPPPFMFNQPGPPIHQHPPFLDPSHNPPFHNVPPMFNHPPPLPKQPLLPSPSLPPLPNQHILPASQPLLSTPPLPNQPYQQNDVLKIPNILNQPIQLNVPSFATQPPLPNQPPPSVITQSLPVVNQPPPAISQQFQNMVPPQNQFSQPPPFTSQPPLSSLPPTPIHQAFPNPVPTLFQPPLPQTSHAAVPVTSTVTTVPLYVPIRLPPKWKSAKDAAGRTYYYHVKSRVSQWKPPLWDQQQQQIVQESESETDSSDSDDDSVSSEDDEEDYEKMDEDIEPMEVMTEDDLGVEELGDSPYEPETMELLEDIEEDTKIKRRDVLVQERVISPRTAEEMPDKLDKRKIRALKEKLRQQKAKEKLRQKLKKSKSRSSTSKCEADTSSDPGRKIKDSFRLSMASVIVHHLNAYRKPDCKFGKITNTEDFKHIARKLTHFVMLKELKHCRSVEELECNDNVKHKAKDFIKKYMAKFGPIYIRPLDDD